MPDEQAVTTNTIPAIRVKQWLPAWNAVRTDKARKRLPPEHHFYIFTLPASSLRALCGVYRRTLDPNVPRSEDLGIQRAYEKDRSDEISEFIRYGWPWSELSAAKRKTEEYEHLQKPGWLPTAIVVNILTGSDKRRHGAQVHRDDLVSVDSTDTGDSIRLPEGFSGATWKPNGLAPLEVIDGQHRLLAFEDLDVKNDYWLPVVAFHGLDLSWQAYLFWTINIKPKRINASFAFDLYPMLRTEDWLERFQGPSIYRESRAQELTEALWSHPESPWKGRINMLGESGLTVPMVSQAAWIRSLMATFVKSFETKRGIGGLFGAPVGHDIEALRWTRPQQAAFLIFLGQSLRDEIQGSSEAWAVSLRGKKKAVDPDPAFFGSHSLLATDQGIRGFLFVVNDLFFLEAAELELDTWEFPVTDPGYDEERISAAVAQLKAWNKVNSFAQAISQKLAKYDWRTSAAAGLTEEERSRKASFRGSGGYKELRRHLL